MNEKFVGIDFGGTNIKIGCFDLDMKLLSKKSVESKIDKGPKVVVERMAEATKKLVAESNLSMESVEAVGIGAPGPLNITEGLIVAAPNLHLFRNTPIRQMLSDQLDKPVVLENDANAACWGEFVLGAGKGVMDMAFLTLGTGIGGGIICNGQLVHGFKDNAAELGHLIVCEGGRVCGCGQKGCVEAYASANSTAARATEAVQSGRQSSLGKALEENGEITCRDVFEHSAAGDELAKEITEGTADMLGMLCVDIFHVTSPQRIVLGEDAGIIGSAALANQAWQDKKL